MDFKEMTRRDAQSSLNLELDKLVKTVPEGRKQIIDKEFDGFKRLFGKFINEKGPSVVWEQIERLPKDAVSYGPVAMVIINMSFHCRLFPMLPLLNLKMCQPSDICWISWWLSSLMVVWEHPWDAGKR